MEAAPRRLVSLKVSPWSERAKWALDHQRLSYQVVEHAPFLGERRLRGRAWTIQDLADEFADLLSWRDELYARHRARA